MAILETLALALARTDDRLETQLRLCPAVGVKDPTEDGHRFRLGAQEDSLAHAVDLLEMEFDRNRIGDLLGPYHRTRLPKRVATVVVNENTGTTARKFAGNSATQPSARPGNDCHLSIEAE
jgi:hypothetical protein